jgi:hypothetical protein
MALERWSNPKLPRRSCTCEYGLESCRGKSAGVAYRKRPRELISHTETPHVLTTIRNFCIAVHHQAVTPPHHCAVASRWRCARCCAKSGARGWRTWPWRTCTCGTRSCAACTGTRRRSGAQRRPPCRALATSACVFPLLKHLKHPVETPVETPIARARDGAVGRGGGHRGAPGRRARACSPY